MKKQKIDSFRKAEAWALYKQSRSRMDLILSTVNSGGIVVAIELGKFLISQGQGIPLLLKFSIPCFILGIVISFVSQLFSNRANYNAYLEEYHLEFKNEIQSAIHSCDVEHYSKLIKLANSANIVLVILGLILLLLPFYVIF